MQIALNVFDFQVSFGCEIVRGTGCLNLERFWLWNLRFATVTEWEKNYFILFKRIPTSHEFQFDIISCTAKSYSREAVEERQDFSSI